MDDALVLGFGFAIVFVGFCVGVARLFRFIEGRVEATARERELAHGLGLDRFQSEVALVQSRRKQLEARHRKLLEHRDKLVAALEEFRGTRAERDFEARLEKVNAAHGELSRAYERLCELEAELWMRRAAFGLVRQVQERLRGSRSLSAEELQAVRMRIEETVREMVDADVRQKTYLGSRARAILDEAQERLREHLAVLRLRELDASLAQDGVGPDHLDALVVAEASLAGFEDEMRELDAMTEAVLEVERMLEPRRLVG